MNSLVNFFIYNVYYFDHFTIILPAKKDNNSYNVPSNNKIADHPSNDNIDDRILLTLHPTKFWINPSLVKMEEELKGDDATTPYEAEKEKGHPFFLFFKRYK